MTESNKTSPAKGSCHHKGLAQWEYRKAAVALANKMRETPGQCSGIILHTTWHKIVFKLEL